MSEKWWGQLQADPQSEHFKTTRFQWSLTPLCWDKGRSFPTIGGRNPAIQLICNLSHYLHGFTHPWWLAGFPPSTVVISSHKWSYLKINRDFYGFLTFKSAISSISTTHRLIHPELTQVLGPRLLNLGKMIRWMSQVPPGLRQIVWRLKMRLNDLVRSSFFPVHPIIFCLNSLTNSVLKKNIVSQKKNGQKKILKIHVGQKVHVSCSLLFQTAKIASCLPRPTDLQLHRQGLQHRFGVFITHLATETPPVFWKKKQNIQSWEFKGPTWGDHSRTGGYAVKMVARWIPTLSPIRWKIFPNERRWFPFGRLFPDFLLGPGGIVSGATVDGRNPANQSRSSLSHSLQGFLTSQVVQEFFHNKEVKNSSKWKATNIGDTDTPIFHWTMTMWGRVSWMTITFGG